MSNQQESAESQTPQRARKAPLSVVLVSSLVMLEALAVLVAAVLAATSISTTTPVPVAGQVFLMVLLLLVAIWQGIVSVKHRVGRAWTRSAVVVWQLFQVIIGIYYISNGPKFDDWAGTLLGIAMLVVGAVALLMVFSPATRAWLEPDDQPR